MLRQDSRHCIQPIGAGQSLRLTHTQHDAEMSPTLASMMLLQRRLDNLSRSSDAAPAPTIPDTSHHHQFPAVECTVPTLPQIHLHRVNPILTQQRGAAPGPISPLLVNIAEEVAWF